MKYLTLYMFISCVCIETYIDRDLLMYDIYKYIYIHCTYVYIYVCVNYVYMYMYMYMYICICICIYVYVYVYTRVSTWANNAKLSVSSYGEVMLKGYAFKGQHLNVSSTCRLTSTEIC